MRIGIDSVSFSTSKYCIDLAKLAEKYNTDVNKYYNGIGQKKMSIFPLCEDIVTIAFDAAKRALSKISDKNSIKFLLFATESGIDFSKSAGMYLHHHLGLANDCRIIELKQACYASTAALQLAKSFINNYYEKDVKVLVIGSDIARFKIGSPSEYTQGGAAVALVVSKNPKILEIDDEFSVYTEDVMDFWRPNHKKEAIVNGKKTVQQYIKGFDKTFGEYVKNNSEKKIDCMCYHTPFSKMALKVHEKNFPNINLEDALKYIKVIGNCYTASVFLSFVSLIENCKSDLSEKNVGIFSFGSGSVSEFFAAKICSGYKNHLFQKEHENILSNRYELNYDDYLFLNTFDDTNFNSEYIKFYENVGDLKLFKIEDGYRLYQNKLEECK